MKKLLSILFIIGLLAPSLVVAQSVTYPNRGGTGTSSIPVFGDILRGFSDGTYGPVATSTLGLPTFSDLVGYVTEAGSQTISGLKTFSVLPESDQLATTSNQFTTLAKVSSLIQGIARNTYADVATTVAGTLASDFENGDTVDGVVLATNNRILIKNQVTQSENGVYTVNASGAPTRATDFDSTSEAQRGTQVTVLEGTTNAGTLWAQTTLDPVIGTDDLVFNPLPPPASYTAGNGLLLSGLQFLVNILTNGGLYFSGGQIGVLHDASTLATTTGKLAVATNGITATQLANSSVNLASADVTGTNPVTKGGTGLTTAADDTLIVGSGSAYQAKTLSDCDTTSSALTYDTTTNNFGCNSITGGGGGTGASTIRYTKTLDVSSSTVAVSNTTAATTVYSYVIPGGTLGTDKGVRVNLSGTYLNNSGANRTVTIAATYGGTTVISQATPAIATSATTGTWGINLYLMAANATNAQRVRIDGSFEAGTGADVIINDNGTSAVDSTSNQSLVVTVANNLASTTVVTTKNLAVAELLNATDSVGGGGSNWSFDTNFGSSVLTPSSTIAMWLKDPLYASSTSFFSGLGTWLNGLAVTGATSTFDGVSINNGKGLTFAGYSSKPQIISADLQTGIHFDGPGIMSFHNSGSQSGLFNGSGNFGLGSTSPSKKLSVVGDTYLKGSSEIPLIIENSTASTSRCSFESRSFLSVVTGMNLSCLASNGNYGGGIDQELAIFGRSSSTNPALSFATNWANLADGGANITYATTTDEIQIRSAVGGFRVYPSANLTNSIRLTQTSVTGGLGTLDFPYIEFNTPGGVLSDNFGGFLGGVAVLEATSTNSDPSLAFIAGDIADTGNAATIAYATTSEKFVTSKQVTIQDSSDNLILQFLNDAGTIDANIEFDETTDILKLQGASTSLSVFPQVGADPMCWDGSGESVMGDCTSLRKYKTNIKDLKAGLDDILKLSPRTFNWKDDGREDVGFIAEEVESVNPQLAKYTDGELSGYKERAIIASLVNAVQEQQTQIENLKRGVVIAVKSADDNKQWLALLFLLILIGIQQVQIIKLRK